MKAKYYIIGISVILILLAIQYYRYSRCVDYYKNNITPMTSTSSGMCTFSYFPFSKKI